MILIVKNKDFFYFYLMFRYIDDVFMSTNLQHSQIKAILDTMNQKDPNIRITAKISNKLDFLDVEIENNQGQLRSTVHHKPAAEPYILPYNSDHPRCIHKSCIPGALFRAIRLCSNLDDFVEEYRNIEMNLLLNGYPQWFINKQSRIFFSRLSTKYETIRTQPKVFVDLHRYLLASPTHRESKESINFGPIDNPNTHDHSIRITIPFQTGPLLKLAKMISTKWADIYQKPGMSTKSVKLKYTKTMNISLENQLIKRRSL